MRTVLVTGSSGLIGSALTTFLQAAGHKVVRLVRWRPIRADREVFWDPVGDQIDRDGLEVHEIDAAVHLAGENLASGRWTRSRKARIYESRVRGTRLLVQTLSELHRSPSVLASASAIGFYGERGEEALDESSSAGAGFLADVCRSWEQATQSAAGAGIRVVNLRLGVVLAGDGGALPRMLTPFRLGLGGRLGSGRQYMSWITLPDVVAAICHCLRTPHLAGPVNLVTPHPVTNAEFTRVLGRAIKRPTLFPVPAIALRILFGEMADQALLASARVAPRRLIESDFVFEHPLLEEALSDILGSTSQR